MAGEILQARILDALDKGVTGYGALAKEAQCSRMTVIRHIHRLEQAGVVSVERAPGGHPARAANRYETRRTAVARVVSDLLDDLDTYRGPHRAYRQHSKEWYDDNDTRGSGPGWEDAAGDDYEDTDTARSRIVTDYPEWARDMMHTLGVCRRSIRAAWQSFRDNRVSEYLTGVAYDILRNGARGHSTLDKGYYLDGKGYETRPYYGYAIAAMYPAPDPRFTAPDTSTDTGDDGVPF